MEAKIFSRSVRQTDTRDQGYGRRNISAISRLCSGGYRYLEKVWGCGEDAYRGYHSISNLLCSEARVRLTSRGYGRGTSVYSQENSDALLFCSLFNTTISWEDKKGKPVYSRSVYETVILCSSSYQDV